MLAQTLELSETMVQNLTPSPSLKGRELEGFRSHLALQGKSKNTVDAYVGDLGVYAAWAAEHYGEGFDLAMFNRSDLQVFFQVQTKELGVSPATWNRRRAALRVFGAWAQGLGLISYDPTDGLPKVEEVELAPQWISGREYGKLRDAIAKQAAGARTEAWRVKAIRDLAVVMLMAECGLREGEVSGLNLGDVTMLKIKGEVRVRYGKGNKSRVVPFNKDLVGALKAWLEVRSAQDTTDAFFVGKGGMRLETRGIQRMVAEMGLKAGLTDLTPHRLRHYFVKSRLDEKASLIEVATLTGHSRLETLKRYGLPSKADLERVQGIR